MDGDGTVCRVRYDGADTLAAVLEKVGGAKKNSLAVEGMQLCDEEGTPVRRTYLAPRCTRPSLGRQQPQQRTSSFPADSTRMRAAG